MGSVRKVGIIGAGHVGAHVASALIAQGTADELVLVDVKPEKLASEVQDLRDSLSFAPHAVRVEGAGADYAALAGCDVIVNAAGHVEAALENRDGELQVTAAEVRTFARTIADAGFAGVWVSIANPCDVVATAIWHLTRYDPAKIIGSGTALDSARLRCVLSQATGYEQGSIDAYMLGEHGFSQFAAWSHARIGGKPLDELEREQPDRFALDHAELEERARMNGYAVVQGKCCTEYGVAAAAARIVRAVLCNEHAVIPCSTLLTGQYGQEGHWASLPCCVGAGGVEEVLHLNLTSAEEQAFARSCAHIRDNIGQLAWW